MTRSAKVIPFHPEARERAVAVAMACRRLGRKLGEDTRGAVALEYGLVVALIVIGVMLAIADFGKANLNVWTNVSSKVTAATG